MKWRLLMIVLALVANSFAQPRVDPRQTYHRVVCVVPYTGSGTAADPKRPLYAPTASAHRMPAPTTP